jgi:uncharacterized protein DUF2442
MRAKASTKKNSTAKVVRVPWEVVDLRVLPGHRLFVRFADDTEGEVDVAPFIFARRAGVFERLRDPAKFARAYVDDGAVTWPGGLDLAPDAMYDDIKATGRRVAGRRPARS